MVQLSNIPEDELFKICLDFWHFLSVDIIQNNRMGQDQQFYVPGLDFSSML
jgi:hypothetical protein